tara:strand:+ start:991 stop:2628 length:1638 start_codon:yes stop_codon:yes gene_type:complete
MLGLKSIYFYFIALQITLVKFFKKIYFSSSYYNKSLQSALPQQVYFNPNPFLLSILTSYKKNSFKISEVNPNIFWLQDKKKYFEELHDFFWLHLIDRKIDRKKIQRIISIWIMKNSKYKRKIWESSILSSRVISWILNLDVILHNGTFEYKKNVLKSIISQSNHLKKNISFEKSYSKRIKILTALILTGLIFKEYEENFKIGIKELEKLTNVFFDKDGFPLSRSPDDLVLFAKYLILCKECIKDAQKYIPEFLEIIVEKNLNNIKFIKDPNDLMPLFNGASENKVDQLEKYLENLKVKKKNQAIVGGIYIKRLKNHVIFFDVGNPPEKNLSKSYQSGPLSFEYHLDGVKIITNCGFGKNISNKAELLSRLTATQSTLTINDTAVTKFERNKIVNRIFGNSIKNTFKISDLNISYENIIGCSASHNGYEKNFGCIHKRGVHLDKVKNKIKGTDQILKNKDGKPIKYVLRFHINPQLTVVKTMGGNSALIQISKNKSLIFTVENEILEIEKSIFLAGKKILDNTCISISGDLVNKDKIINWEIKKNI